MFNYNDKSNVGRNGNNCRLPALAGFVQQVYDITLLFLTLDSVELAIQRVQTRVKEGGHNIPIETIERRYSNGLMNFFKIYRSIVSR